MFTYTFQFFLVFCTLGTAVVAVLTYRADRREAVENADRAYTLAMAYTDAQIKAGYYDNRSTQEMKNAFDDAYIDFLTR